jgi:hypothetical protein
MASENDHGISRQPGPTCPMLDAAIDNIRDASRLAYDKADPDDIEAECDSAEANIENARHNVERIRDWGREWKEFAKQAEYERQRLENILKEVYDLVEDEA